MNEYINNGFLHLISQLSGKQKAEAVRLSFLVSTELTRMEKKHAIDEEKTLHFVIQQALDLGVITVNQVFGAGELRAKRFMTAFAENLLDYSRILEEDRESDPDLIKTQDTIDTMLKPLLGKDFRPWKERYSVAYSDKKA